MFNPQHLTNQGFYVVKSRLGGGSKRISLKSVCIVRSRATCNILDVV